MIVNALIILLVLSTVCLIGTMVFSTLSSPISWFSAVLSVYAVVLTVLSCMLIKITIKDWQK